MDISPSRSPACRRAMTPTSLTMTENRPSSTRIIESIGYPSPDPGAGDPIDVGIRQQAEDIEDLAHAGLARAKAASA
jgi:hypothetical protein